MKNELLTRCCLIFRTSFKDPTNFVTTYHSILLYLHYLYVKKKKSKRFDCSSSGLITAHSFDRNNISCQSHFYNAAIQHIFVVVKASILPWEDQTSVCHLLEHRSSFEVGINCQWKDCTLKWLISHWSSLTRERKNFWQSAKQRSDQPQHNKTLVQVLWFVTPMNEYFIQPRPCHQEPEC